MSLEVRLRSRALTELINRGSENPVVMTAVAPQGKCADGEVLDVQRFRNDKVGDHVR